MAKLNSLLNILGHYKYLITIVLGLLVVGVIGDNSFIQLMKLDMQKEDLQTEIDFYTRQHAESSKELKMIKHNSNAVEKVARERYFMKRDNEDVFMFSTDEAVGNEDMPITH